MTLQIFDCEQGSPEWFAARLGLPTASKFHSILAKGEGKTRRSYLYALAAEIISGIQTESFQSAEMKRGRELEPEARNHYAFVKNVEPQLVGFVRNGNMGASPDSFIGDDGVLEIKTQRGDLLIDTIIKGEFPPEHRAQTQGSLLISGREWIDLYIYCPGMPAFIRRSVPDKPYLATLKGEIDRFNDELAALVARIQDYGALQP
jgi:YqaJ-like viral recombinase domain